MKIRFTRDNRAISFDVPKGEDPAEYGKKKLREMTGRKKLVGWEHETIS